MQSTITERGQTVVPAAIRARFGLSPADKLHWVAHGSTMVVRPVKRDPIEEFRAIGRSLGLTSGVDALLADRQLDREMEEANFAKQFGHLKTKPSHKAAGKAPHKTPTKAPSKT